MNLAEKITAWAAEEASVEAIVLIGSRVRASEDAVWRADEQSDWDFQIISAKPELFAEGSWARSLGLGLSTYAVRPAAIGGVPKVAALFAEAEADFVILPAPLLRSLRAAVKLGQHRESPTLRTTLQDLSVVVRPGWRFLKGGSEWEPFYQQVVAEIDDPRLNDAAIASLADGLVCDAVWARRKIERGELIAAQRMLHRSLAETNFRLLHELKLRRGERTFPEGRRLERIGAAADVAAVTVSAVPEPAALHAAVEKCAATCRELVRALVGDAWRWPDC